MNDEKMRRITSGQQALTAGEVDKLLSKIPRLDHELLITLAIVTGIRRDDIVAIERSNIDLKNNTIRFYQSKKSNWHTVPISTECAKMIKQHVYNTGHNKFLFNAKNNKKTHICGKTAYNVFQIYLDLAGLSRRPFHTLRATCIKLSQQRGWTIEQVMALTDDSFRTIKEHYDTPSDDEMQEVASSKPIL